MQITDIPKQVLGCQNVLGESIVWDDRTQQLWWTNIHARELWCWAPWQSASARQFPVSERVGAVALCEDGGLAVALEKGFGFFHPASGALEKVVAVEAEIEHTRLNDGRVDPVGRFLCGGMHEGSPQRPVSALWSWQGGKKVTCALSGIACANSLGWSPDGATLYFTDMPTATIQAFSYDCTSGELSDPRRFADLIDQPGLADGSVVDEEGFLWNAQWGGARLVRYTPEGQVDRVLPLPVDNPTCLTFGGENLDVLFVTTAWWGLSDAQRQQQPLAGNIFAFKPGVRGQREHRFIPQTAFCSELS